MGADVAVTSLVTCVDSEGRFHKVPVADLSWRPSAYSIVIKDDKLLVCRRDRGCDLPGGRLMLGELPEAAAIRETKEETGIEVAEPHIVGLTNSFFRFTDSDDEPDPMQCLMLYYHCRFVGGSFLDTDLDAWEQLHGKEPYWYSLNQLDDMQVASSRDFRPFVKQALAL